MELSLNDRGRHLTHLCCRPVLVTHRRLPVRTSGSFYTNLETLCHQTERICLHVSGNQAEGVLGRGQGPLHGKRQAQILPEQSSFNIMSGLAWD